MKFKQKKTTKASLSEKIADALTVKPRADIEDDQVFGTNPQTVSRADFSSSDSEDDAAISDFRKSNVTLLSDISKKYVGEVVSRTDYKESGSEVSFQPSDTDDYAHSVSASNLNLNDISDSPSISSDEASTKKTLKKEKCKPDAPESVESPESGESDDYSIFEQHEVENNNCSDDESEAEDDNGEGYDISQMEDAVTEQFEHLKKQNVSEDAQKGKCVRNQLLIWEGLLEMRIHVQCCMNTANQMPLPDTFEELKTDTEFEKECSTTKAIITTVIDKFMTLQNLLFKSFPETKTLSNSNKKDSVEKKVELKEDSDEEIPSDTDNEEIPSDTDAEEGNTTTKDMKFPKPTINSTPVKKRKLEDYEEKISTSHKSFKPFRDATIQKWNDKTRLANATNIKNTQTNTILQQISYILSDREKLLRRTQLKRSEYDIVGYNKPKESAPQQNEQANPVIKSRKDDDEYLPEIFDDSDFYHQLLRELIECKSADISDPVQLSRQWIALQQMRSKMKRKVDTKATKGRKIKYVVHNKLVNYMAPEKSTTWTDESANELYSSLFGKMFERNNVGINANFESGFKIKN